MIPDDAAARERAIDPLGSYCVSAPAGSGKTSLLVMRLLGLLTRVAEPENVVAITFTRKAAAEMRARVFHALQIDAANPPDDDEHAVALHTIAGNVRAHDARMGWDLLANPTRLRIQTIDSFCGELMRQMPVLSGSGGQVSATDRAEPLYREAIENFLHRELAASRSSTLDDIHRVLLHVDNQWETTVELLSGLLRRREQWQPAIGAGLDDPARDSLREVTAALVDFRIDRLREKLADRLSALHALMAFRRQHLDGAAEFEPAGADLAGWQSLAALLLTNKGEWRKTVNKRDGFPPGKGEAAARKADALALLADFREANDPALIADLQQLTHLPDAAAEPEHWEVLAALTRLLPRLGAELLLVFQRRGEVDHPQIAMAALAALGEDSAPTDIALRLDHRIEHLLVDEFQDTSSLQFELIRRLTRGWNEHNAQEPAAPRTLFLVGDAMQSIYGFREANVGLFMKARDEGIGDMRLESLTLTMNFRSRASLVNWVNQQFSAAFPAIDDAQTGAVSYSDASAARAAGTSPQIALFAGEGAAAAEAAALCDRLEQGLDDSTVESIAILGRSRNQLRPFIEALRERQIPFAARDLDKLEQRTLIRDLVTLCSVLSDRHDRFAWLSLLRCPGLALDNADLLRVALSVPTAAALLNERVDIAGLALSDSGRERLAHVAGVLGWADHFRDRLALRVWVEACWLRLGGAASLRDVGEQRDAEQFFACLEQMEQQRHDFNARELAASVEQLFASPGDESCKVQVMTLHKAKGLEFDWVFLPSLSGTTKSGSSDLLLWDEFALPGYAPAFLLDIRSTLEGDAEPRLYHYLKHQAKQKRDLEATRLFYVGCTRAADYLWLSASLGWDEGRDTPRDPPAGSLLASIWPALRDEQPVTPVPGTDDGETAAGNSYQRLCTLPALAEPPPESAAAMSPGVDNRLARAFGTALHRCLEALVWRSTPPPSADGALLDLLRVSLLEAGADTSALAELQKQGESTLNRVLADPWAQWMLSRERPFRAAERPLSWVDDDGSALQLVLDYVFVDEQGGERWLVDFKTAEPRSDQSVESFVEEQLAHYATQLEHYARALAERFSEPVRCALYFTALGRHAEYVR